MDLFLSRVRFYLRRIRVTEMMIGVLVVITVYAYWGLLKREQGQLLALSQQIAQAKQSSEQHGGVSGNAVYIPKDSFYVELPSSKAIKPVLKKLFDVASDQDLVVDSVNYQLEQHPQISFSTYTIDVPMTGKYLDIMKFVDLMLKDDPTLALKGLSISRQDINTNDIDAHMQFALYLKKQ